MATITTTSPAPKLRGEGLTYQGSLTDFHGQTVLAMYDCPCASCELLDPWDPALRVSVYLTGGARLEHARLSSFHG